MRLPLLLLALLSACPALAQEPDARIRDALRRTTQELRAAQDLSATASAALATVTAERDAARAEVAGLQARLADAVRPAAAPPPGQDKALAELQRRNAALSASVARTQDSERRAGSTAQAEAAKAAEAKASAAKLQAVADSCTKSNAAMAKVATEVVHLYQDRHFRALLVLSDEPMLGLKRVELENMLQDYEDTLRTNTYRTPAP